MSSIDVNSASIDALMQELGQSLKKSVKNQCSITQFVKQTGVSRSLLYRTFDGKPISTDNLLRILKGLNRMDIIISLLETPKATPLELLDRELIDKKKKRVTNSGLMSGPEFED